MGREADSGSGFQIGECGDTILISQDRHGHTTARERAGLRPAPTGEGFASGAVHGTQHASYRTTGETCLSPTDTERHTTARERAGLRPAPTGEGFGSSAVHGTQHASYRTTEETCLSPTDTKAHNGQRAGRSETGPYGRGFRIKRGSRHTARVISDYGRDMSLPYGYKGTQRPESGPVRDRSLRQRVSDQAWFTAHSTRHIGPRERHVSPLRIQKQTTNTAWAALRVPNRKSVRIP